MSTKPLPAEDDPVWRELRGELETRARELGFAHLGITDTDLGEHAVHFERWLAKGFHGEMDYMARHGTKRTRPDELVPGTLRVISVRMEYWPEAMAAESVLADPEKAYISRYALGRDYHKLMRKRLARLAEWLKARLDAMEYRAFVDSAPVLERAVAQKAGLGWIGKNAMLIHPKAGSYAFLGELFTNIPLPIDEPFTRHHCGRCNACIPACPTDAIVAPGVVDARRCISYLTIEYRGDIPEELRPAMGNRIFGCDDCQLVCPWNRFATVTAEPDFNPRLDRDKATLLELFEWSEETFLTQTEGSPIRRIGYECWLRNIAVALGNGPATPEVIAALRRRRPEVTPRVQRHIDWALARLTDSCE
ncbi:tRNA epoxyqueuosine(34) reductase QueG [Hahella sp. SMD15-11]|uniref:Epoxyqueuosine reductase n=1 Tax=Thermohahella caldifontis TaxID=3142973 RepID=A0AB39UZU8_9GAMM